MWIFAIFLGHYGPLSPSQFFKKNSWFQIKNSWFKSFNRPMHLAFYYTNVTHKYILLFERTQFHRKNIFFKWQYFAERSKTKVFLWRLKLLFVEKVEIVDYTFRIKSVRQKKVVHPPILAPGLLCWIHKGPREFPLKIVINVSGNESNFKKWPVWDVWCHGPVWERAPSENFKKLPWKCIKMVEISKIFLRLRI